jgi:CDP-glucose 4,6-dehydratase
MHGERPIIRSDGQYIRDYFYVEDGVLGYLELAEQLASNRSLAGEAFNFSNEIQVTGLELVKAILRLVGRDDLEPDVRGEANHEIRHQYLDAGKARQVLKWHPQFSLQEGLTRTVKWYREFFDATDAANVDSAGTVVAPH